MSAKKHRASKKEVPVEVTSPGFWDAPPEVPFQNFRRMLTSLEKELELLTGVNEIKKKKTETDKQSASVPLVTTVHDSALSPKSLQHMQQPSPPTKVLESVVSKVSGVNTDMKKAASRVPSSAVRQTTFSSPSPNIATHKTPSMTRYSLSSFDRYKNYKTRVLQAYQNRKIFTIHGNYYELKAALLSRGWIEKLPHESRKSLQKLSEHNLLLNAMNKNDYEVVLLSKMLENYPAYFIWQPKNMYHYFTYAMPYRNRIRLRTDLDFTTKEGLLACVNQAQERGILGAEQIIHPRTFRLSYNNEVNIFERSFKLTYCFSLLLFVSEKLVTDDVFSPVGEVNLSFLEFALLRIQKELATKKGWPSDIVDFSAVTATEWTTFMSESTKVLNKKMRIRCNATEETVYKEKIRNCIDDVKKHWPMFKMEGYSNIWIVKPSNYCRGYGIVLMTDLGRIINQARMYFKMRYIAQKYIERPLLIYKAKFDIRQYVLVTIRDCITIYLYGDCYVKFSSQEFSLENLHESVHVTNYSIQSKYKNGERSGLLPPHNMWSLSELKNYFKSIKKDNIWESLISPRMIKTVTSVMMASYGSADLVMNSFEMYGLDFMITEDFEPVLIEINATPDLTHSTCVTARICPAAVRDLVKVVVDLPSNPHSNIGNWKPVYKVGWARTGNSHSVIPEYTNLLQSPGNNTPTPTKPSQVVQQKITNHSPTRDIKTKKSNTKKSMPPKSKPPTNTSKYVNKKSNLNSKLTNTFVKDVAEKVQSTKKNLSRKEAIGKQVFQAIEALYSNKPVHDFQPSKSVKFINKKGKGLYTDQKFLKELGNALYSKIWN